MQRGGPLAQQWHVTGLRCSTRCRCAGYHHHHQQQQHTQEQQRAPLLDAVVQRGGCTHEVPLHVPGHKRGRALDAGMLQLLSAQHQHEQQQPPGPNVLSYDLTELAGLDFLSSPSSVIQDAQQLAAAALGAERTWFLVNGCSAGIHAAVMAAVRPGQALLLARNCHLSAFSACVLADCVPVWLQPEQDAVHGVAHCITPQELQAGFAAAEQRGLSVGAVLLVSPTYFGAVARVAELAGMCHARGVPLLLDEAHGAHLAFLQRGGLLHAPAAAAAGAPAGAGAAARAATSARAACPTQRQPLSALAAGADVAVQSSHKVLTAMTQSAMLHLQGGRVAASRISSALQVLQTSSPSYLLLASLDAARRHAQEPGVWAAPCAAAAAARAGLAQLPGLRLLQGGGCGSEASVAGFDPLRLVLNVAGRGWTGYEAATSLEQQHAIVPELATQQLVVFVFGPGSTLQDAERLVQGCSQLPQRQGSHASQAGAGSGDRSSSSSSSSSSSCCSTRGGSAHGSNCDAGSTQSSAEAQQLYAQAQPAAALTPRQAFNAATVAVPLAAAVGRVSAELLCPYPPGVPVVFPGERLSSSAVAVLQQTLAAGGTVVGAQDAALSSVLVVVEQQQ